MANKVVVQITIIIADKIIETRCLWIEHIKSDSDGYMARYKGTYRDKEFEFDSRAEYPLENISDALDEIDALGMT